MMQTEAFRQLLGRVVPDWENDILAEQVVSESGKNFYSVTSKNGKVVIRGDNAVSMASGLYAYLKQVMRVNLSWCGNSTVAVGKPKLGFAPIEKIIDQKYRVYMNYCTLSYTMAYWDFDQWEKEIDFMAMRGINMPLAVVGTEYVMFETLKKFGFSDEEGLQTVSAPAFQAWQWMTNIDSYQPIPDVLLLKKRLSLGQKIMRRYIELGMYPIQQGFSGHVPMAMKEKFPSAKIVPKAAWCDFPRTAQLDPLDPLFLSFGNEFLKLQDKYFGSYGFYATDPFHEGHPPRGDYFYLRNVGRMIDKLLRKFQPESVWVMQSWSIRKHIAKAVPKSRLLILDLDGARCKQTKNFWGYNFVSGHLHNFGGKNSLHGDLKKLAANKYAQLKKRGGNLVGTGLFPEGVEQNPVYYDLLFDVMTEDKPIDTEQWLEDYAVRRYGAESPNATTAWKILLESSYAPHTGAEEEAGSIAAARPAPLPKMAACNDHIQLRYDNMQLWSAILQLNAARNALGASDGYQFDMVDFVRQAISNRIVKKQYDLPNLILKKDIAAVRSFGEMQIEMMRDLDAVCALRKELTLARWQGFAKRFGQDTGCVEYCERTAKLLITVWGNINGNATLFDYAWREWSGLISDYYIPRWQKFYAALEKTMSDGKEWTEGKEMFFERPRMLETKFGKELFRFEREYIETPKFYPETEPQSPYDVLDKMIEKYGKLS